MTLADDDMEAVCASFFGTRSAHITGPRVVTPPAAALAGLRWWHAYLERSMGTTERPLASNAHLRWLEHNLITAMLNTINDADSCSDTMARQHHQMIINRFFQVLNAHPAESLNMQALSEEIGVSSRTFRMACQQQLGVSPTQYMLLQRMRLARRALQQGDPALTRVTDIATSLGFWELGRFAVKYHEIFGETPSATLRACHSSVPQPRSRDYALA